MPMKNTPRPLIIIGAALLLASPWPILALALRSNPSPTTLALPSQDGTLSSPLTSIFSRSPYFVICDTKGNTTELIENPYLDDASGAGLKVSRLLASHDAGSVVTENMGPEMFYYLKKRGVRAFRGSAITVQQAIDQFRQGQLVRLTGPTVTCRYGKRLRTPH